ncbi:hypothetical protein Fmac_025647 [Flemingia macrophylla]|uniref:Uncharacterized protein n=1 Tax=Flemingia macrophylla TaxID=520843 RepID=A0ABD1LSU1_9FABA
MCHDIPKCNATCKNLGYEKGECIPPENHFCCCAKPTIDTTWIEREENKKTSMAASITLSKMVETCEGTILLTYLLVALC